MTHSTFRHIILVFFMLASLSLSAQNVSADFVDEAEMKAELMQMLARFTTYMKADFREIDDQYGCFAGENTMGSDERGVRPNADMSMICAFLCKYGRNETQLPTNVSWQDVERMATKSLAFAVATHKAIHRKSCADGKYWGSTSLKDHTWESSLWAMSVAYSALFQWNSLSDSMRNDIRSLLKAECNYELERDIPTGFIGDTKAEENGWEADVLAVTLALFPQDALAEQWKQRMFEFAFNSYSHPSDTSRLVKGPNLYPDYTLQNHDFFHTSYQNVVIQELGEAALILKIMQTDTKPAPVLATIDVKSLLHNCDSVTENVLNWLSLPDGEQAMPNGNDWSLFLYDQITSYSTMACMLRNRDALMLENMAFKQIRTRQNTTSDGSWLLKADVGARRMGVQAHRVMMTWLMHHSFSTANLQPETWQNFLQRHLKTKYFPCQDIIRTASSDRFVCFSWSAGKQSYTGYIAPFCLENNNLTMPWRRNNTGNIVGWYEVDGCKTNARPAQQARYVYGNGSGFVMNGELICNDSALNRRFALYASPENAVVYLDYVRANRKCRITKERSCPTAFSYDEFTKTSRDIQKSREWLCVDGTFGIVTKENAAPLFSDPFNNNSITTRVLYAFASDEAREVGAGSKVGERQVVYYANRNAEETARLARETQLISALPEGWKGIFVPETNGKQHLLLCNFASKIGSVTITKNADSVGEKRKNDSKNAANSVGAPIFSVPTTIKNGTSTATFSVAENSSFVDEMDVFCACSSVLAQKNADGSISIRNLLKKAQTVTLTNVVTKKTVKIKIKRGEAIVIPHS